MSPRILIGMLVCGLIGGASLSGLAAAEVVPGTAATPDRSDFDARRKLRTAMQVIENGEDERGVAAIENLLERYPDSRVRFEANLVLGRHALMKQNEAQASVTYLERAAEIEHTVGEEEQLVGDSLEIMLESMYLIGVASYRLKQYQKCFPILRKITTRYPNTIWANQAYYFIGMAHFVQKNWGKAIRYLSLVGTYVDGDAESTQYVEAGQRLFIKVTDADLPVLQKLGQLRAGGKVRVRSAGGDEEEIGLVPLSQRESIYIATIPTVVAEAVPRDGRLQVVGGDTLTISYSDGNTTSGAADVIRNNQVAVVSSGTVGFTLATFEGKARQAYTGQDVNLLVMDVDHDTDAAQQHLRIRVTSRYAVERKREETTDFIAEDESAEDLGPQWEIRDEVEVDLAEMSNQEFAVLSRIATEEDPVTAGQPPAKPTYHTGRFIGRIPLVAQTEATKADKDDNVLVCRPSDQIYVKYVDSKHADGTFDRVVEDHIKVVGAWNETIRQTTDEGADTVIQAKKNLVEGEAFLALARIFKEMGLMRGAQANVDEGLFRIDSVLKTVDIASELKQRAFRLRWELYLLVDDLPNAIATMQLFGMEYPDSHFADQALLGIGEIYLKQKLYDQAVGVFQKILDLPESLIKADAQYSIAVAVEEARGEEAAIPLFQKVADNYPNSEKTGEALVRLVKYYIRVGDFVSANNLLTIVFEEHPDKQWLDEMLIHWALLAYRMKDYQTAYDKAQQLLMEYPDSDLAPRARTMLSALRKKIDNADSE